MIKKIFEKLFWNEIAGVYFHDKIKKTS